MLAVSENIWLSETHIAAFATLDVVRIHLRKFFFESESNTFAHHSNAVDSVDQGIRFGV